MKLNFQNNNNNLYYIPHYPHLEDLNCHQCRNLIYIDETNNKLKFLDCTGCINLRSCPFPSSLLYLRISYCNKISKPIPFENFSSLRELRCHDCSIIPIIPRTLVNLKVLIAFNCKRLVSINANPTILMASNCPYLFYCRIRWDITFYNIIYTPLANAKTTWQRLRYYNLFYRARQLYRIKKNKERLAVIMPLLYHYGLCNVKYKLLAFLNSL